jgi:hypothetical protein
MSAMRASLSRAGRSNIDPVLARRIGETLVVAVERVDVVTGSEHGGEMDRIQRAE